MYKYAGAPACDNKHIYDHYGVSPIFVSPWCYNTHMNTEYQVYTWVCTGDCDALIVCTFRDKYGWPNGVMEFTCPCGSKCTLLSVEPDTILPITTTKEGQTMETETTMNNLPLSDLEKYNPDMLVTYKVIRGYSDPEYVTDKVRNIEWELSNARQNSKLISIKNDKINSVRDIIIENFADSHDQDILKDIAEVLEIELTKEVEWSATIEVSGVMTVSLVDDFDLDSEIMENLTVETNHGEIEVNDYEVTNVREAY